MIYLKRVFALVLVICFVLPLSQCSPGSVKKLNENAVATDKQNLDNVSNTLTYARELYYPYKVLDGDNPSSFLVIAVFFFSLPFLLIEHVVSDSRKKIMLHSLELIASGFSAYGVVMITMFFHSPLIAGYLALFAIFCYTLITLVQLGKEIIYKYSSRKLT